MADKTAFRLIYAVTVANHLHVEHIDVEAALLHEKFKHEKPVYIYEHLYFDGTFSKLTD